jgi:hypothetical protein
MRKKCWLLPLCCTLLALACKPAAQEVDGPYLLGSVYAIVDNQYFEGQNNLGSVSAASLNMSAEGATDSTGPLIIRFAVGNFKGAGRYPISAATTPDFTYRGITYKASSGYVDVSSASGSHITGTFSFLANKDSLAKRVSAGRFELYQ